MVALVTGAGGFLGSYVAQHLEAVGMTVERAGRPRVEIPSPAFDALVGRSAPSLVVHCATPSSVGASVEHPAEDLYGSATVLSALLDRLEALERAPRIVFVGSAAVYGQPSKLPVDEEHPRAPLSPYGRHRAMCEDLLREREARAVVLRVFSAYGEGLRRQVLWDICRKAVESGRIELAGSGEETRDFVHARDVAAAIAAVAAHASFEGESYNVGTGTATSIHDVAMLLAADLGNVPVSFNGDRRLGDPDRWQADVSRLRKLGWAPATELRVGIRAYARWALGQLAPSSAGA